MQKRGTGLLLLLALLLLPHLVGVRQGAARANQNQDAPVVITHANVIDGTGDQPLRDATVIVRAGRIASVATGRAEIPPGARVIDLQGKWLLPGLIDAHTHIDSLSTARAALASGVTTARNMGTVHFVDIGMRELRRAGVSDLPELLSAGYHIYPRPAEGLFLDFPQLYDLMSGLSGVENVRRVVRAQLERGVNFIKVNATDRAGTVATDPRRQLFTEAELAAIVQEARRGNVPVAAHAHGDEGARAAVRAGVLTIEHGTYLSSETLRLMKERGTYLVPTLATMAEMIEPRNDVALQIRGRHMAPRVREAAALAIRTGVRLLAGTDTDYGATSNYRLPHELIELVRCGLSPLGAIRAATVHAAECFGLAGRTGAIRVGLEADMIAVERDPLADIANLQEVLLVVNDGRVIVNRLKW